MVLNWCCCQVVTRRNDQAWTGVQVATSPVRRGGPSLRSQQEAAANAVPDHAPAAPQDDRTARFALKRNSLLDAAECYRSVGEG